jgi:hypothetical protein
VRRLKIAKSMRSSAKGLNNLNLCDNQIGPDGARGLGPGLAALQRLQRLNAADNRLGPACARDVAASVASAAGLRWVGLEGNQLDSDSVRGLADAARAWRSVAGPLAAAQGGGGRTSPRSPLPPPA